MPSSPRSGSLAFALAAAVAAACASSPAEPKGCQVDAECAAGARCLSGACVTNTPPTASVAVPSGALEATRLLVFDGSASRDPDTGDAIASSAWTFRAVSAPCAPPTVSGTGPTATVRFACAGRFAVDLAVSDRLGATAGATKEFDVTSYTGPPLLTVGPDVSVGHACTTGPLHCAPSGPVALSASLTADAPAGLSLLWTAEPPAGLALDAARRVAFTPGPADPAPTVSIDTDGQAISGDWIFRIEARDAVGVVASGAIRVSVGNRPPILTRTIPVPDHAFDGAQFTAAGEVAYALTDPDGDPLGDPLVEFHHVGDGPGGAFTGQVFPGRVTFSIAVPYAAPDDAQHLIGGPQLERSITFSAADVNGARVADVWPILVGNRPPALVTSRGYLATPHRYDATAARYLADANVATWDDPDGDPLSPTVATGSSACSSYEVRAGVVIVHCSANYAGAPLLAGIVGAWTVSTGAGDPWTAGAPLTTVVEVQNTVPRFLSTSASARVSCVQGACCRKDVDGACVAWWQTYPAATLSFGIVADDDGDPLNLTVNGVPQTPCVGAGCAATGSVPERGPVCGNVAVTDPWTVDASDTGGTASAAVSVTRRCL